MKASVSIKISLLLLLTLSSYCSLLAQKVEKKVHVTVVQNGKDIATDSSTQGRRYYYVHDDGKNVTITRIHRNKSHSTAGSVDSVFEVEVNVPDIDSIVKSSMQNIVVLSAPCGSEGIEIITEEDEDSFAPPPPPPPPPFMGRHKCCMNDSCMKMCKHRKMLIIEGDSLVSMKKGYNFKIMCNKPMEEGFSGFEEFEYFHPAGGKDTTIMHVTGKGDTMIIVRKTGKGVEKEEVTIKKHSKDSRENQVYVYMGRKGKKHVIVKKIEGPEEMDEGVMIMPPPPIPPSPPDVLDVEEMINHSDGVDEKADFGRIKVLPMPFKNKIRIDLELSGKDNTDIKIADEKGKIIFSERVKELTGKYVRDIDMTGNSKGNYTMTIGRAKSTITKQFTYQMQ